MFLLVCIFVCACGGGVVNVRVGYGGREAGGLVYLCFCLCIYTYVLIVTTKSNEQRVTTNLTNVRCCVQCYCLITNINDNEQDIKLKTAAHLLLQIF